MRLDWGNAAPKRVPASQVGRLLASVLISGAMIGSAIGETHPAPRPKPVQTTVPVASVATVSETAPESQPDAVSKPTRSTSRGPVARPRNIAPVHHLDPEQYKSASKAVKAALAGEFRRAFAAAEASGDPATKILVEWLYARSSTLGAGLKRISRFLDTHPDWPDRNTLRSRAEALLYSEPHGAREALDFFAKHPPRTGAGRVAQASAYLSAGNRTKARALFIAIWREEALGSRLERTVRARCDRCITKELDRERMDRMAHRGQHDAAERAAKRLGSSYAKLALARKSVAVRSRRAKARLSAVPKALRANLGYSLSRAAWLRRNDKDTEALAVLKAAPGDAAKMLEPEAWWTERRLTGRRILGLGKAADAYAITARHGLNDGRKQADAEFLAGWIALRHLNDPAKALPHFKALRSVVKTPISLARADYWIGRALEAAGSNEDAQQHYIAAARHGTTYYGQLARTITRGSSAVLDLPDAPGSSEEIAALEARTTMRAARLLATNGSRYLVGVFLRHMATTTTNPDWIHHLSYTANTLALPNVGVRIGKSGLTRGVPVYNAAFPMVDYPIIDPKPAAEEALLLALTRQESEFRWQAESPVGARGLMQVMPATGKMLARDNNIPFSLKLLSEDPGYNARFGATYITDRIEEFGGSYILAIASYNAGPGRVRQWIERFGDPRDPDVDPIDWVETIPFDETRNYVQRVMENLQVYRARLNNSVTPIRLAEDLIRGRARPPRAASVQ